MNAYARLAEPSSAPADLNDVTDADPPNASAMRLLAEWFIVNDDGPPPELAERTVNRLNVGCVSGSLSRVSTDGD